MAADGESLCHLGATPKVCAHEHVAALVPKGMQGDKANRACPCHDDRKASLSINSGDFVRVRWKCQAGCSPEDVRAALLGLGVDESCLGTYALPKRALGPGMRTTTMDPAIAAIVKRYRAIRKASGQAERLAAADVRPGDHRGRRRPARRSLRVAARQQGRFPGAGFAERDRTGLRLPGLQAMARI